MFLLPIVLHVSSLQAHTIANEIAVKFGGDTKVISTKVSPRRFAHQIKVYEVSPLEKHRIEAFVLERMQKETDKQTVVAEVPIVLKQNGKVNLSATMKAIRAGLAGKQAA